MEIIEILEKATLLEDFERGSAQDTSSIVEIEKKLDLKLPESYVEILHRYGYISCIRGDIYGVSNDPYFDVVKKNIMIRNEILPDDFHSLPDDAFVIDKYMGGGYYMLFGKDSKRAGQVALFLDETYNMEDTAWPNLESFLEYYYF